MKNLRYLKRLDKTKEIKKYSRQQNYRIKGYANVTKSNVFLYKAIDKIKDYCQRIEKRQL